MLSTACCIGRWKTNAWDGARREVIEGDRGNERGDSLETSVGGVDIELIQIVERIGSNASAEIHRDDR